MRGFPASTRTSWFQGILCGDDSWSGETARRPDMMNGHDVDELRVTLIAVDFTPLGTSVDTSTNTALHLALGSAVYVKTNYCCGRAPNQCMY